MSHEVPRVALEQLHAARAAEKEQALYYRALAAVAEKRGHGADIEALNGLLADEQHHVSRLSARLVELGEQLRDVVPTLPGPPAYPQWRTVARAREQREIARYQDLLRQPLDADTAEMVQSFLAVEREHERHLGGKYTEA
jgi:rubrerythrin